MSGCGCAATRRSLLAAVGLAGLGLGEAARATPARPRRIDVHHHIAPPEWLKAFRAREPGASPLARWSPQASLDDMDAAGVETAMLSITSPGTFPDADVAFGRRTARESNDYARRLADDHPGRFGVFAALPLPDIDGCLREIAYAFDVLKADGVGLMTSYGPKWLGDPAFFPVLEELNRRKAVVYTHPTNADCCRNLQANVPPTIVEFGADTTRTVASILFSGAALRFRDIRWIFSHAGGATPFLVERFARHPRAAEFPDGVEAELRRFFYDTAQSANRSAMGALRTVAPVPQILFGTDYPFRTSLDHVKGLADCGVFSAAEQAAIVRGNALRLFPRFT